MFNSDIEVCDLQYRLGWGGKLHFRSSLSPSTSNIEVQNFVSELSIMIPLISSILKIRYKDPLANDVMVICMYILCKSYVTYVVCM
jgi:hypothetical protein